MLMEAMLTVTLQVHATDSNKLVVASLKQNQDLRQVSMLTCDSFLVFTRKLCDLADIEGKSAPKMLEAVHEACKTSGYNEVPFNFNGCKVDKNLMASVQSVLRSLGPESETLLNRTSACSTIQHVACVVIGLLWHSAAAVRVCSRNHFGPWSGLGLQPQPDEGRLSAHGRGGAVHAGRLVRDAGQEGLQGPGLDGRWSGQMD